MEDRYRDVSCKECAHIFTIDLWLLDDYERKYDDMSLGIKCPYCHTIYDAVLLGHDGGQSIVDDADKVLYVCPDCQYLWVLRIPRPKSCPICKHRLDTRWI